MSHSVTVKSTQMTDIACLEKALAKLGLEAPVHGTHTMYDHSKHVGYSFKLPNWQEAVVVDEKGQCYYDNFRGHWGDQVELDKLIQEYSNQKIQQELQAAGYTIGAETYNDQNVLEYEAVSYAE